MSDTDNGSSETGVDEDPHTDESGVIKTPFVRKKGVKHNCIRVRPSNEDYDFEGAIERVRSFHKNTTEEPPDSALKQLVLGLITDFEEPIPYHMYAISRGKNEPIEFLYTSDNLPALQSRLEEILPGSFNIGADSVDLGKHMMDPVEFEPDEFVDYLMQGKLQVQPEDLILSSDDTDEMVPIIARMLNGDRESYEHLETTIPYRPNDAENDTTRGPEAALEYAATRIYDTPDADQQFNPETGEPLTQREQTTGDPTESQIDDAFIANPAQKSGQRGTTPDRHTASSSDNPSETASSSSNAQNEEGPDEPAPNDSEGTLVTSDELSEPPSVPDADDDDSLPPDEKPPEDTSEGDQHSGVPSPHESAETDGDSTGHASETPQPVDDKPAQQSDDEDDPIPNGGATTDQAEPQSTTEGGGARDGDEDGDGDGDEDGVRHDASEDADEQPAGESANTTTIVPVDSDAPVPDSGYALVSPGGHEEYIGPEGEGAGEGEGEDEDEGKKGPPTNLEDFAQFYVHPPDVLNEDEPLAALPGPTLTPDGTILARPILEETDPFPMEWTATQEDTNDWMLDLSPSEAYANNQSPFSLTPIGTLLKRLVDAPDPVAFHVGFQRHERWQEAKAERRQELESGYKATFTDSVFRLLFGEYDNEEIKRRQRQGETYGDLSPRLKVFNHKPPEWSFNVSMQFLGIDTQANIGEEYDPPDDDDLDDIPLARIGNLANELESLLDPISGDFYQVHTDIPTDDDDIQELTKDILTASIRTGEVYPRPYWKKKLPWSTPNAHSNIVMGPVDLATVFLPPPVSKLPDTSQRSAGTMETEDTPLKLPDPDLLAQFQHADGIPLGFPLDQDNTYLDNPVRLPNDKLTEHILRAANTGHGKSIALINDMLGMHEHTEGATILVEPKGGNMSMNYLQSHYARYGNLDDVYYFEVPDRLPAIPFFDIRPLLDSGQSYQSAVSNKIEQTIDLMRMVMGYGTFAEAKTARQILSFLIQALYDHKHNVKKEAPTFTFDEFRTVVEDYRNGKIPRVSDTNQQVHRELVSIRDTADEDAFKAMVLGVENRLRSLVEHKHLYEILNHDPDYEFGAGGVTNPSSLGEYTDNTFHLEKFLDEDAVIIMDIGELQSDAQDAFAILLLANLWDSVQHRKQGSQSNPIVNIIIEEAASVAGTTLVYEQLLPEARGFDLSIELAMQFPAQVDYGGDAGKRAYRELLNNVKTKLIGEIKEEKRLAPSLAHESVPERELANRMSNMTGGEFIVDLTDPEFGDPVPHPFSVGAMPIPSGHPDSTNPLTDKATIERFKNAVIKNEHKNPKRYDSDLDNGTQPEDVITRSKMFCIRPPIFEDEDENRVHPYGADTPASGARTTGTAGNNSTSDSSQADAPGTPPGKSTEQGTEQGTEPDTEQTGTQPASAGESQPASAEATSESKRESAGDKESDDTKSESPPQDETETASLIDDLGISVTTEADIETAIKKIVDESSDDREKGAMLRDLSQALPAPLSKSFDELSRQAQNVESGPSQDTQIALGSDGDSNGHPDEEANESPPGEDATDATTPADSTETTSTQPPDTSQESVESPEDQSEGGPESSESENGDAEAPASDESVAEGGQPASDQPADDTPSAQEESPVDDTSDGDTRPESGKSNNETQSDTPSLDDLERRRAHIAEDKEYTVQEKIKMLRLGFQADEDDYRSLGLTENDVRFIDLIHFVMTGEVDLLEPGEPIDFIEDFEQVYGWDSERISMLEEKNLIKSRAPRGRRKLYTVMSQGYELINREYASAPGEGDIGEDMHHIDYIRQVATAIATRPDVHKVEKYYETSDGSVLDLAALDENGEVIYAVEVERLDRETARSRDEVMDDYEKLAKVEAEAIWVVERKKDIETLFRSASGNKKGLFVRKIAGADPIKHIPAKSLSDIRNEVSNQDLDGIDEIWTVGEIDDMGEYP